MDRLALQVPVDAGVNETCIVVLVPGANRNGRLGVSTAKPSPFSTALISVQLLEPEFPIITDCVLLAFGATPVNTTFEGFVVSCSPLVWAELEFGEIACKSMPKHKTVSISRRGLLIGEDPFYLRSIGIMRQCAPCC
jgi:hypothetical protein